MFDCASFGTNLNSIGTFKKILFSHSEWELLFIEGLSSCGPGKTAVNLKVSQFNRRNHAPLGHVVQFNVDSSHWSGDNGKSGKCSWHGPQCVMNSDFWKFFSFKLGHILPVECSATELVVDGDAETSVLFLVGQRHQSFLLCIGHNLIFTTWNCVAQCATRCWNGAIERNGEKKSFIINDNRSLVHSYSHPFQAAIFIFNVTVTIV